MCGVGWSVGQWLRGSTMEFRGWLFFGLMSFLLAVYLWATSCRLRGAPAPIPRSVKPVKPSNKLVEGPYSVASHQHQNFTFVLLPNGVYRGHFTSFNNSSCQDWCGTWKLDFTRWTVHVTEWPEGIEWYGDLTQCSKWYINIRRDSKGRIIRDDYICHYWQCKD